jgi:hypothetical protein
MVKNQSWSQDFINRKNADVNKPVIILDLHLGSQDSVDSETYFFNDNNFNFNFWSYSDASVNNYIALGMQLGAIPRRISSTIESLNLVVDNVSRAFSILFTQTDLRGKRLVIRQVYADLLTNQNDYDLLFDGILDSPRNTSEELSVVVKHSVTDSLNFIIPRDTFYNQCNNRFTDSKCANGISGDVLKATTTGQTIDTVISQVELQDTARTEGTGDYWTPGVIEMTGGTVGNIGIKRRIVDQSGDHLFIETNFPSIIEVGDEYTIERDCDKTFEECKNKFSNDVNFRGFKYLPNTLVNRQLIR